MKKNLNQTVNQTKTMWVVAIDHDPWDLYADRYGYDPIEPIAECPTYEMAQATVTEYYELFGDKNTGHIEVFVQKIVKKLN